MKVYYVTILIKERFGYFIVAASNEDECIDCVNVFLKQYPHAMAFIPQIGIVPMCETTVAEPMILLNNSGFALGINKNLEEDVK